MSVKNRTERKAQRKNRKYDVVVVGGGPAGFVAAIAAARNGAKTLLVERYGFLGGNLTAAGVLNMRTYNDNNGKIIIAGIPLEFARRLKEMGGAMLSPEKDACVRESPEHVKYLTQEMVLESGGNLLLHTLVVGVIKAGHSVKGIVVENKSGRSAIFADVMIDASGDGDVMDYAGAEFEKSKNRKNLQPMTLTFLIGGIPADNWPNIRTDERYQAFLKAYEKGKFPIPRKGFALFPTSHPGEMYANVTRCFGDCTNADDLTQAEIEGRRQVHQCIEFYRKYIPGFENCYLISTAPQIGTRESRRLVGRYTLTKEDILAGREFEDRIARGAYGIDIHSGKDDGGIMIHLKPGLSYTIPYRALVPKSIDDLLVAGRCISATRAALGAVRVMVICMAMGQAAGTAAALAVRKNAALRDLDVTSLQKTLVEQGVILDA